MKIRTKEQLYDLMVADLGWRKKELAALRQNVRTSNTKLLPTAIRCAVVMLYAHWEGFIKNAAESYLVYIKLQRLSLSQVSTNILALSLKQKLNEFSQTNKATLHIKFIDYAYNNLNERVSFSENDAVKTSNLNSEVLKDICQVVGINYMPYELKANLIDGQLLNYRNTIAHGNNIPIGPGEYENLHLEVITMLESIFNEISNSAVLGLYKKTVDQ